jgi:AcrR family transcriptional regulator
LILYCQDVPEKPRRSYDATKRRERAEQERRATRQRVLAAAQRLFEQKGYTATTIDDIAAEAGVAIQSVYKAGNSKAELLQRVVEVVVAGDDEQVLLTDRPTFAAIADEPDAARQIAMIAALVASTQERSARVQVALREAAAVDATVAENLANELQRRHETIRTVIGMVAEDRLRVSHDDATDTVWAIGSTEVFLLLRTRRGWDETQFVAWLTGTLSRQLLADPPTAGGQP